MTLTNATISGNTAAQGGRGVLLVSDGSGLTANAVITNSILGQTDNSVTDFATAVINSGIASISSGTNNLIRSTTTFGGTASNADPLLGALAANGGPTPTMLPASNSPALNSGSDAAATAAGLTTDQRGLSRFVGGVDLGAVERDTAAHHHRGRHVRRRGPRCRCVHLRH